MIDKRATALLGAVLGAFLLLGGLTAWLFPEPHRADPAASTYNAGPQGAKALYTALGEAGVPSRRWRRPVPELAGRRGLFVCLAPSAEAFTPEQARELVSWVRTGNRLLLASDSSRATPAGGRGEAALLEELGIELSGERRDPDRDAPPGAGARASLPRPGAAAASDRIDLGPCRTASSTRFPTVALYSENGGDYAFELDVGGGHVVYFASADPFRNGGLRSAGNAALAAELLRSVPEGGEVLFDELHHGFAQRYSWSRLAETSAFRWFFGQALVLALLYVGCSGARFGPVRNPGRERRRSSAEYVAAMAALYRKAGLNAVVGGLLFEGLKDALARRRGARVRNDPAALEDALARSVRRDREGALASLRRASELLRTKDRAPRDAELVEACREIDALHRRLVP